MGRRDLNPVKAKPLPPGAWPIANVRAQGYRPAKPVIVTFVGETPWDGEHVHCESGKSYDWAWSEDLPLMIVMAPGIDISDALRGCFWPTTMSLLTLVDIENERVSHVLDLIPKPKLWHLADVSEYFPKEFAQ